MNILRLIRFPNLVILFLTQYILYFGWMVPVFSRNGIMPEMSGTGFAWMFLITVLITISGYIINDLIDVPLDLINKKDKMVIGKHLSIQFARYLYLLVFMLGFILSWMYASRHDNLNLLFIYPLSTALLAFYSYRLKGLVLWGNVMVSVFSAGVAGIIYLFEQRTFIKLKAVAPDDFNMTIQVFLAFIVFAFLSTLYREIVKDIEDLEGDKQNNINTIAVKWGKSKAKNVAFVVGLGLLTSLAFWMGMTPNEKHILFRVAAVILIIVILVSLYFLHKADHKNDFYIISQLIKLLMFFGLMYLILYVVLL